MALSDSQKRELREYQKRIEEGKSEEEANEATTGHRRTHSAVGWVRGVWWAVLGFMEWQLLVRGYWGVKRTAIGLDPEERIPQFIVGTLIIIVLALIPILYRRLRGRARRESR